jgi:hypothetical protein
MIISSLFDQVNAAYRGSDDDAPVVGTTDYTLWLATANRKKEEWARDSKNVWLSNFSYNSPSEPGTVATTATTALTGTSTYFTDYRVGDKITVSGETERTIATIVSDTSLTVTVAFSNTTASATFTHTNIIATGIQSYSLHRSLLAPSDQAIVTTTNQTLYYQLGKPQERDRFTREVYISGRDPQTITFYDTIASTDQSVGGTLIVPGYYIPADYTSASDVITVDDPYWLVYAVASELAFNDLTYESKYVDLNNKANNLYNQMVITNRRGTSNYPRIARTNVNRIRDTSGFGTGNFE